MSKNNVARTILGTTAPLLIASGAGAWAMITRELKNERIMVHGDSAKLAGKPVAGPLTAFEQARIVSTHAGHIGGGRTFAEISEDWMAAQHAGDADKAAELAGPREMVMQAGFVRASLFTSVIAYGVSALVMGMGVVTAAAAIAVGSDD